MRKRYRFQLRQPKVTFLFKLSVIRNVKRNWMYHSGRSQKVHEPGISGILWKRTYFREGTGRGLSYLWKSRKLCISESETMEKMVCEILEVLFIMSGSLRMFWKIERISTGIRCLNRKIRWKHFIFLLFFTETASLGNKKRSCESMIKNQVEIL